MCRLGHDPEHIFSFRSNEQKSNARTLDGFRCRCQEGKRTVSTGPLAVYAIGRTRSCGRKGREVSKARYGSCCTAGRPSIGGPGSAHRWDEAADPRLDVVA